MPGWRSRSAVRLLSPAVLLALAGCAGTEQPPPAQTVPQTAASSCPPGLAPMRTVELLMGRNKAGRLVVTDAAWDRFLAEEVTPRFPDGLSVLDARGQWLGSSGRIEREPSKILYLVLPAGEGKRAELGQVIAAYKARFGQESVGVVETQACAGF